MECIFFESVKHIFAKKTSIDWGGGGLSGPNMVQIFLKPFGGELFHKEPSLKDTNCK
jgi:hypothetical protein